MKIKDMRREQIRACTSDNKKVAPCCTTRVGRPGRGTGRRSEEGLHLTGTAKPASAFLKVNETGREDTLVRGKKGRGADHQKH